MKNLMIFMNTFIKCNIQCFSWALNTYYLQENDFHFWHWEDTGTDNRKVHLQLEVYRQKIYSTDVIPVQTYCFLSQNTLDFGKYGIGFSFPQNW